MIAVALTAAVVAVVWLMYGMLEAQAQACAAVVMRRGGERGGDLGGQSIDTI